ncbi:hypothetical protein ANK1_4115 [plant metagenome]|uniref:Uncharacterized protein n=1 Tax=plant metagenome TaxID=1297885 RepID=A0A484Q357_9ZZZZ
MAAGMALTDQQHMGASFGGRGATVTPEWEVAPTRFKRGVNEKKNAPEGAFIR